MTRTPVMAGLVVSFSAALAWVQSGQVTALRERVEILERTRIAAGFIVKDEYEELVRINGLASTLVAKFSPAPERQKHTVKRDWRFQKVK